MKRNICVFCASSEESPEIYRRAARKLGLMMARKGHGLVFGGGKVGLMGEIAQAMLDAGGHVVGVIPEALRDRELALETVNELVVTRDMRERKATMAARCDAFIALPGGFGTFEEITEVITHRHLGFHEKPCVVLNVNGFFRPLIEQFEIAWREGFVSDAGRDSYHESYSVEEALDFIESFPV